MHHVKMLIHSEHRLSRQKMKNNALKETSKLTIKSKAKQNNNKQIYKHPANSANSKDSP